MKTGDLIFRLANNLAPVEFNAVDNGRHVPLTIYSVYARQSARLYLDR
jgi:hypothetical protein